MSLPKRNSADGRCYWMKPEVQEELQPLFDQCIQDAIDGRITRLDSLWPPVVVSSEGAPFEVHTLVRKWAEAQQAETLDAEKAIAFSENLRRQSRWGEIDYLCGGGCRTLFPWGDGLDYSMHLHHFESEEDQGKLYDMEQANFFGLSIAYDPYKRELVDGKILTTCGGDGGCNICGGMGPLLGYLPCSPHCKPEVREDNEIHNDYDFFRPVIRVQTSGWRMVSPGDER